jgi:IS30 family transposase
VSNLGGTDLSVHTQAELDAIADSLNNRPRATHAFHSPLEAYAAMLKAAHQPSTSIH